MNNSRLVKISKYLSKHLRHQPDRLGIKLAPGGWVAVDELIAACKKHSFPINRAELNEVVERNAYSLRRMFHPGRYHYRRADVAALLAVWHNSSRECYAGITSSRDRVLLEKSQQKAASGAGASIAQASR